ncbi:hypothetical protein Tco_0545763 [Tanacetum coccineum]
MGWIVRADVVAISCDAVVVGFVTASRETLEVVFASILTEGTHKQSIPTPSQPALVLDDLCLKECDFSNSLMGQVKEVAAIPNLYTILSEEGFQSAKLIYLGGLWVLIGFDSLDILEKFYEIFRKSWWGN